MEQVLTTRCGIARGEPAGMLLGFLLARMGVDVARSLHVRRTEASSNHPRRNPPQPGQPAQQL